MTQKEKQLLFKDLCARLPYGVILNNPDPYGGNWDELISIDVTTETVMLLYNGRTYNIEDIKPYLRPMSSMTEEEYEEYENYCDSYRGEELIELIDWLNQHHFDYRCLIEKGLALKAPEGMYKIN